MDSDSTFIRPQSVANTSHIDKIKQRFIHEIREYLVVCLLLAPFFLSFGIYKVHLVGSGDKTWPYATAVATALFSALVLGKVILIGDLAKLGRRFEKKPLMATCLYKAAVFTLLYALFRIVENTIRGMFQGLAFADALESTIAKEKSELVILVLVVYFAFLPLFALREIRRTLGAEQFRALFLGEKRSRPD
jgi:hypothetical protein